MTTPQHIIDMARAAGITPAVNSEYWHPALERFYNLAIESARDEAIDAACKVAERWIAKEREECAKLAEEIDPVWESIADAIRARSK